MNTQETNNIKYTATEDYTCDCCHKHCNKERLHTVVNDANYHKLCFDCVKTHHLIACSDCGDIIPCDDSYVAHDKYNIEYLICDDCSNKYGFCDVCEELHDKTFTIYTADDCALCCCDNCLSEFRNPTICKNCNNMVEPRRGNICPYCDNKVNKKKTEVEVKRLKILNALSAE